MADTETAETAQAPDVDAVKEPTTPERTPDEIRHDTLLGREESPPETPSGSPEGGATDGAALGTAADTTADTDDDEVEIPEAFVDQLRTLGFSDVEDESDGQQRLLESYAMLHRQQQQLQQQLQTVQPLINYGQEYLKQLQDPAYQNIQQQRSAPGQPQTPQGQPQWWTPPEADLQMVERYRETRVDPQTGQTVYDWKADTPAQVRAAGEAYAAYRDKWIDDLANRPNEILPKIIEQEFTRLFEENYGNRVAEERNIGFVDQLERDNAHWLYHVDPRTNEYAVDPQTGDYMRTPAGEAMFRYIQEVRDDGVSDPNRVWEHALNFLRSDPVVSQQTQQQKSQAAQATRDQKQIQHLRRGAASTPQRGGSVPPPERADEETQNSHLSAGQKLLASMQAAGVV